MLLKVEYKVGIIIHFVCHMDDALYNDYYILKSYIEFEYEYVIPVFVYYRPVDSQSGRQSI